MDFDNLENSIGLDYFEPVEMDSALASYGNFVERMMLTSGETRLVENTLGLVGEAGEVAEKIKKKYRDGVHDDDAIIKELGDVLFYVTALANHVGYDLQHVMDKNVEKLQNRAKKNTIQGSGDNR